MGSNMDSWEKLLRLTEQGKLTWQGRGLDTVSASFGTKLGDSVIVISVEDKEKEYATYKEGEISKCSVLSLYINGCKVEEVRGRPLHQLWRGAWDNPYAPRLWNLLLDKQGLLDGRKKSRARAKLAELLDM